MFNTPILYIIFNRLDTVKQTFSKIAEQQPALYPDFMEFTKTVITKKQIEKLTKLMNFKFEKHSRYNMEAKRLKKLEDLIQFRVKEIIKAGK